MTYSTILKISLLKNFQEIICKEDLKYRRVCHGFQFFCKITVVAENHSSPHIINKYDRPL